MAASTNHRMRYMANNLIEELASANITVSSELSGFPYSNVKNASRFRVWKTEGTFTIDSTNNKVYINDGSDQTATITSGDYTPADLATEIQTQLNSVSSSWTCTYSTSTYKFTIERTTGTNVLRLSQTSNAAWDTLGFTGSIDDSTDPFEADESRLHTHESVIWDLGASTNCTFFSVISPSDITFPISSVATVNKIEANSINDFSSAPFSETVTRTDNGIFHFFDESYRYWKWTFTDRQNTVGPEGFKFGHIYLGDFETFTQTNIARGFQKAIVDPSESQETDGGQQFFRDRTKYWRFTNNEVQLMTAAERANVEQFIYDTGKSGTFYVSLDPTLAVSSSIDEMTKYVRFANDPVFRHVVRDLYNLNFELREAL